MPIYRRPRIFDMSPKGMLKPNEILDMTSLREQVYRYIRREITSGKRIPGSCINLKDISSQLGISTTPLRDAIIRLECEGFVTILPRRGILVNKLTLKDIRDLVEICGMIESSVIISTFDKISPSHIKKMESLNVEMRLAINQDDFDRYYKLNIAFHGVFLDLSENRALHQIVMPIKQRLYDFPRRAYIKKWEERQALVIFLSRKIHPQILFECQQKDSQRTCHKSKACECVGFFRHHYMKRI